MTPIGPIHSFAFGSSKSESPMPHKPFSPNYASEPALVSPSVANAPIHFVPLPEEFGAPMYLRQNGTNVKVTAGEGTVRSPQSLLQEYLTPLTATYQYNAEDKVGEGTYGSVYIGYHKSSGQRVAIKKLKQLPNFEGFPITSTREIAVHRHLQSLPRERRSNLLVMETLKFEYVDPSAPAPGSREEKGQVHPEKKPHRRGMAVDSVVVYLVFPFVEHTLSSIRRTLRSTDYSYIVYNEDFILYIFLQVLEGIKQLHDAHIMHRDIKEDNILITSGGCVKICDFGLAVPLDGERSRITPSLINMFYRPPEMLLHAKRYSTAVDIWSAGCLLAQQYLGVPPFISASAKPDNDIEQLLRVTDVLGPVPSRMLKESPVTKELLLHPKKHKMVDTSLLSAASGQECPSNVYSRKLSREKLKLLFEAHRRKRPQIVVPSSEALYMIHKMLALDPSDRPSVDELLDCPPSCARHSLGSFDPSSLSISTRQAQLSALCWKCKAKKRGVEIAESVKHISVPRTHMRPKK